MTTQPLQDTEDGYTPHTTDYSHASPGVGAVLTLISEIIKDEQASAKMIRPQQR